MGKYDGAAVDHASVLEAVPQPIAVCDAGGDVLFLNVMAREFLGVDEDGDMPRFSLTKRDTFSEVRLDTSGPLREYFLADVEVVGAARTMASMSLSPIAGDRYRVVLESAPRAMVAPVLDELDALVAICDERRNIRLANAALSRLQGKLGEDGEDCDLLDIFDADDRAALRVAASEALAGSSPEQISAQILPQPGREGVGRLQVRIRPLNHSRKSGEDQGTRGFLMVAEPGEATFSDLRKKFARAEELMSLGQLATGVAHELKNPLTSILNYADYLAKKYRGQFIEQSDGERLQRIIDGVERIDRFVRDLLNLADAERLELEATDLHATLRASVELTRRTLREFDTEIDWQLQDDDALILGHQGALKQVFSNLVLNAARAMAEEPGGEMIAVRTLRRGEVWEIEVEDRGCGMSEETRRQIFEPFYSASINGNGAGLGLALVHRLIEEHDGQIEVESRLGEGTCFTVSLPALSEG